MKLVIAGGSGHVGSILIRHFAPDHEVVVLTRGTEVEGARAVQWDGVSLGTWAEEIDGADVVINLAGRSVNCRYSAQNLNEMMQSRVLSTRIIGEAIRNAVQAPRVWLQASTATIYAHRFDKPNEEETGIMGGDEPGAPFTWNASIHIAKAWEAELNAAEVPLTRKVAMRSAMTMSVDKGSVFDVFAGLSRRGLGGSLAGGKQFVSWIHERDFGRALSFLIEHDELSGPVNVCSPNPLPQSDFARELRRAVGVRFGLPAAPWMIEVGTRAMQTESELVLKSRRVVPRRLLEAGFEFEYLEWASAVEELSSRWRS